MRDWGYLVKYMGRVLVVPKWGQWRERVDGDLKNYVPEALAKLIMTSAFNIQTGNHFIFFVWHPRVKGHRRCPGMNPTLRSKDRP